MIDSECIIQLTIDKVLSILEAIKYIRMGVVGDGCLDVYWDVDMRISKLSRETPHYPFPVIEERMYLGAGANVAANIKSLGVDKVYMLMVIGKDWRGECLMSKLSNADISTRFVLSNENRVTPAYCKPLKKGYSDVVYEGPRIDFDNRKPLAEEVEADIIENLEEMEANVDIIVVCDQFEYGIITPRVREKLQQLGKRGKNVVVDSRFRIGAFRNVIIKPNEIEALEAIGKYNVLERFNFEAVRDAAVELYKKNQASVIITLGDKGALWYAGEKFYLVNSVLVEPPIDFVGAGDAFLAAFCCAYSCGFSGPESVAFGNLVSSVVIQKIGMAGTATPEEIINQYKAKALPKNI